MIFKIDTEQAVFEFQEGEHSQFGSVNDPKAFELISQIWLWAGWNLKYSYRFSWFGRPIIQLPEDIVRLQEIVYSTKPDLIIETGVAHGGSLVLFASICEAMGHGRVIGVDVEIRPHNRAAIEAHPLFPRITLIEGSSIETETFEQVRRAAGAASRVLVFLDSNHSRLHVLKELRLYGDLVSVGSYLVVADGIMEAVADTPRGDPEWKSDNPLTAIEDFLAENEGFVRELPMPLFNEGLTGADVTYFTGGWLRRIK